MRTATIRVPQQTQDSEFYIWSFPGAPVRVHLYLEVVRRMEQYLTSEPFPDGGFAPQRGLLLGRVDKIGRPEITDFSPLLTSTIVELEDALTNCQESSDGLRPLGYYQTHPDERLYLTSDDLSRAQAFFPDPHCVFLLIHPLDSGGHANAGFFFWDGGQINGDFCFLEFPFEASLLAPSEQCNATPDIHTRIDRPLLESPVAEPPHLSETTRKTRRPWRALQLSLATVLLSMIGFAGGFLLTQKIAWLTSFGTADATPLALKVQKQGTDIVVTWNRNSALVNGADTGRLTIYDREGASREFSLSKEYLRSGSVLYSPTSDHVRVQLDVLTPNQTTSESVVVLLDRPGTPDSPVVLRPSEPPPPVRTFSPPCSAAAAGASPATPSVKASVQATKVFDLRSSEPPRRLN